MQSGMGSRDWLLGIYLANRPPVAPYDICDSLLLVSATDLQRLQREGGNHWRKIVNLLAKVSFSLDPCGCESWQNYRDQMLFKKREAVLFGAPEFDKKRIHLVTGKTYASQLLDGSPLLWLDEDFAVIWESRLIVTPYFDYRQLSNLKLERLIEIIRRIESYSQPTTSPRSK